MRDTYATTSSAAAIHATHHGAVAVVEVPGEVDRTSSEPMLAALQSQVDHRPIGLVVDLTRTTFFDSTGINVLLTVAQYAQDRGVPMVVATDQRPVLLPLRITRVDTALTIHPTVALALTALLARQTVSDGEHLSR